jgi:hypothetical protein
MAYMTARTARAALAGARAVPAPASGRRTAVKGGARSRVQRISAISTPRKPNSGVAGMARPDDNGRFGKFGGRYVPETLIYALDELVVAYKQAKEDPEYQVRGPSTLTMSRASPVYAARGWTRPRASSTAATDYVRRPHRPRRCGGVLPEPHPTGNLQDALATSCKAVVCGMDVHVASYPATCAAAARHQPQPKKPSHPTACSHTMRQTVAENVVFPALRSRFLRRASFKMAHTAHGDGTDQREWGALGVYAQAELQGLLTDYVGRESPLYFAERLSEHLGNDVKVSTSVLPWSLPVQLTAIPSRFCRLSLSVSTTTEGAFCAWIRRCS